MSEVPLFWTEHKVTQLTQENAALRAQVERLTQAKENLWAERQAAREELGDVQATLARVEGELKDLEKHIYETWHPSIPWVGLPSRSPAFYRVTEAARQLAQAEQDKDRLRDALRRITNVSCYGDADKITCLWKIQIAYNIAQQALAPHSTEAQP